MENKYMVYKWMIYAIGISLSLVITLIVVIFPLPDYKETILAGTITLFFCFILMWFFLNVHIILSVAAGLVVCVFFGLFGFKLVTESGLHLFVLTGGFAALSSLACGLITRGIMVAKKLQHNSIRSFIFYISSATLTLAILYLLPKLL